MECRPNCGACCIAPSINSPLPGMPNGKPAGVACIHLLNDFKCAIFNQPERPDFCGSLKPSLEMCGPEIDDDGKQHHAREYAIAWLNNLEQRTKPNH